MARSSKPLARVFPSSYGLKRFEIRLSCLDHLRMRAYSLDSKSKVVEPVIRGMPKAEPAHSGLAFPPSNGTWVRHTKARIWFRGNHPARGAPPTKER
jgi:hypothetical protein